MRPSIQNLTAGERLTINAVRSTADHIEGDHEDILMLSSLPEVTRKQWHKSLFSSLRVVGFDGSNRDERLDFLALLFNRAVSTADELTRPECHALVAAINEPTLVGTDILSIARKCRGVE